MQWSVYYTIMVIHQLSPSVAQCIGCVCDVTRPAHRSTSAHREARASAKLLSSDAICHRPTSGGDVEMSQLNVLPTQSQ
ncbi:hypothetical protein F5Y15DRAFT_375092 [Xylariaceae sp. FL0016]|nr:hypothetical protein F5Y15DRAFT_375092 [Xylariaceae sp. FL0016]